VSSLREQYESIPPPPPKCKVCDWLREQSEEDRDFFDSMANGDKAKLHKACTAAGMDAEISTVRNHIRKRHTVKAFASDSENEAIAS
jgi:hypothetical protein